MSGRPTRTSRLAAASNAIAAASSLHGSSLAPSSGARNPLLLRQKQSNLTAQLLNIESNLIMSTSSAYSSNFEDDVLFPPGDSFFSSSAPSQSSSSLPSASEELLLLKVLDNLTDYIGSKNATILSTTRPATLPSSTTASSSSSSERLRR